MLPPVGLELFQLCQYFRNKWSASAQALSVSHGTAKVAVLPQPLGRGGEPFYKQCLRLRPERKTRGALAAVETTAVAVPVWELVF